MDATGQLLPGAVRNKVGVVAYPDGRRYTVAVFTRCDDLSGGDHAINTAIGAAATQAVAKLRA